MEKKSQVSSGQTSKRAKKLTEYGVIIPENCLNYSEDIMKRPQFTAAWNENYEKY